MAKKRLYVHIVDKEGRNTKRYAMVEGRITAGEVLKRLKLVEDDLTRFVVVSLKGPYLAPANALNHTDKILVMMTPCFSSGGMVQVKWAEQTEAWGSC